MNYVWKTNSGKYPLWRGQEFGDRPVLPVFTQASRRAKRLCLQGSALGRWVPAAPALELAMRDGVAVVFDLHRSTDVATGKVARTCLRGLDSNVEFEDCLAWTVNI